jgi:hypothetical protein
VWNQNHNWCCPNCENGIAALRTHTRVLFILLNAVGASRGGKEATNSVICSIQFQYAAYDNIPVAEYITDAPKQTIIITQSVEEAEDSLSLSGLGKNKGARANGCGWL